MPNPVIDMLRVDRINNDILAARAAVGNLLTDLRPMYLENRGAVLRAAFAELEWLREYGASLIKQDEEPPF